MTPCYLHLMTQFYRSVEKVLGLETVDEGKAGQGHHREVTWPQFVQYLLKTSPQRDVSEFVVYSFFDPILPISESALEVLHRSVFTLPCQLHLCCPP